MHILVWISLQVEFMNLKKKMLDGKYQNDTIKKAVHAVIDESAKKLQL